MFNTAINDSLVAEVVEKLNFIFEGRTLTDENIAEAMNNIDLINEVYFSKLLNMSSYSEEFFSSAEYIIE